MKPATVVVEKSTNIVAGALMKQSNIGLYEKYTVTRNDGKSPDARYFVIDLDNDPFAKGTIAQYMEECHEEYPLLAHDLMRIFRPLKITVVDRKFKISYDTEYVEKIKEDIMRFGQKTRLMVNENWQLLDGRLRLKLMKELGVETAFAHRGWYKFEINTQTLEIL